MREGEVDKDCDKKKVVERVVVADDDRKYGVQPPHTLIPHRWREFLLSFFVSFFLSLPFSLEQDLPRKRKAD